MSQANLQQALENIDAEILRLTASPIKPNYSLDGESYSYGELLSMLLEKRTQLQAIAEGPYEVRSRGIL